jgi:N-acyl homoserine lactone hydrolase
VTTHDLYLLHLGRLGERNAETGEARFSQVPGYLIRTAAGRTVLVDTGNPAPLIGAETARPWAALLTETRPEDDVLARLADLGIGPGDVDLLISTHFDFDHCGRHDAFGALGTESLVQRRHLEAARADPRRYDPALWEVAGIRYTPIDGDHEIEPGFRILETSGHAIGHQSVYVETGDGPVILAVDAISAAEMVETRQVPWWYSDREEAVRSIDRLVSLAEESGALLVFGHEASQWDGLPKSPRPYRRS